MRAMVLVLSVVSLLGCGPGGHKGEEQSYIKEKHENGPTKTEWRYAGDDSLNRKQVEYHTNGKVFISGNMRNGERHGEWKSFHPNGKPWSVQTYENGSREGETRNWFENGRLRYVGQYKGDERAGSWTFFTAEGDTALTRNF